MLSRKSKDMGAVAEYRFASECIHRDILPCWPSSDKYPYDMILDTGKKRIRVQVKGTLCEKISFSMKLGSGIAGRRRYTKEDADFVVLYSFYHDVWYILPIAVVPTNLTAKPDREGCRWERYKDAWHLLRK